MNMEKSENARVYHEHGVVRIKSFFSADELARVRDELQRYMRTKLSALPESDRVMEADGRSVRNMWRMEQHDAYFKELGERKDILDLIGDFVRGEPLLTGVETFNKPALVGSGVPWHQDNAYFCLVPPDALTLWIAIDEVTEANGAVYYIQGSHRDGVFPHIKSGVAGNSMKLAAKPGAAGKEFCATLAPGDAVIHHCQTIHRSEPNTTDKPRCGLLMVYKGKHTQADPKLKAHYEQGMARKV